MVTNRTDIYVNLAKGLEFTVGGFFIIAKGSVV
jgi:hypothetical protein